MKAEDKLRRLRDQISSLVQELDEVLREIGGEKPPKPERKKSKKKEREEKYAEMFK